MKNFSNKADKLENHARTRGLSLQKKKLKRERIVETD
jgi:hypothetical protein